MSRLNTAQRIDILKWLVEGASMRAISRNTRTGPDSKASINTITKLLVDAGTACADFHDQHVRGVPAKRVQADEIWTFTYAKQKNVGKAAKAPEFAGDTWTWTGIDADSKLVISWLVGHRDWVAAYSFMHDMAKRLTGRVQLTTDGLALYRHAVEGAFGADGVDYAMLVKVYGSLPDTEYHYSPPKCLAAKATVIEGDPDPAAINTSYVERHNLTMRMSMRRFTRLTNAFSKKVENHVHHLALYFVWFNWCRRHKTTRLTPAMAAGLTDTWHDYDWLESVVREAVPPRKPGPKPRSIT